MSRQLNELSSAETECRALNGQAKLTLHLWRRLDHRGFRQNFRL